MSNAEMIRNETKNEFMKMIRNSWTWDRMTDLERMLCGHSICDFPLVGFREKRHMWEAMNSVYTIFLYALGYDGPHWREPAGEEIPF